MKTRKQKDFINGLIFSNSQKGQLIIDIARRIQFIRK